MSMVSGNVLVLSKISCCSARDHSVTRNAALPLKKTQQRVLVISSSAVGAAEVENEESDRSPLTDDNPSCIEPDFSPPLDEAVCLVNPFKKKPTQQQKPLLVYFPGMNCTCQGIRQQLPSLLDAGYDVRCVYIPSSDRSSWTELVRRIIPLLRKEAKSSKNITLLGESFGGRLALHLAVATRDLVSQLILVNPATNFADSSRFASVFGQTWMLGVFPQPLYELAQDILFPFMVKRNRVSRTEEMLSPLQFVPPDCAAWRLSMLGDQSGLLDKDLLSVTTPTLILASAKDRLLSSMDESLRLEKLLPNAKRVILPDSGHAALLEDDINLVSIAQAHGFCTPHPPSSARSYFESPLDQAVPNERMDELGRILAPWRLLTSPLVSGAENLPSPQAVQGRSVLFVGNHTIFGVYDSALLVHELYLRGFKCRSMAHPFHWTSGVGQVFQRYGSVKATKFQVYRLLKEGQHVLLFPGGAREVCKRRGEEYKLLWKSDTDFVRLAIRHNVVITPFAAIGGDDAFNVLFDSDDILNSSLGDFVRELLTSLEVNAADVQPVSGLPFTNIPSLIPLPSSIERIYFHFAECIDTREVNIDIKNREECRSLYFLVKKRVQESIAHLQNVRANDPERHLGARLLARARRFSPTQRIIKRSSTS